MAKCKKRVVLALIFEFYNGLKLLELEFWDQFYSIFQVKDHTKPSIVPLPRV